MSNLIPKTQWEARWPVIVIGAGPVGLLLANLLGRQNIRCFLIEKRLVHAEWSKAIGITPPSLEILGKARLHRPVLKAGVRVKKAIVHDERGPAGSVSFEHLESRFRFILTLPQSDTMKILEYSLAQYPSITFRRGLELTELQLAGNCLRATLNDITNGRSQQVFAQYVVGCDGSDSTTRSLAGILFKRKSYRQQFVMADYEDTTPWAGDAHFFFTKDGSLESFPLPGAGRRWVSMVAGSNGSEPGEKFLADRVEHFCGHRIGRMRRSPVFRFTPEKIIVSQPASGRVILAGDAAHVMSPIGGQGMNTGFADAELVASVMPELLGGGRVSSENLLSEYNRRRRRAAESARRRAATGMWVGTRTGRAASAVRRLFFRRILLKPPLSEKLAPYFAMLTIPHRRLERSAISPRSMRAGGKNGEFSP